MEAKKQLCTIKNIQSRFPEWSKSTVSNKIRLLRDAMDKPKPIIITMKDFLKYYGTME